MAMDTSRGRHLKAIFKEFFRAVRSLPDDGSRANELRCFGMAVSSVFEKTVGYAADTGGPPDMPSSRAASTFLFLPRHFV